ncbi:MAG: acyltransferase [Chloroflexi bacterium]|nr:MAG: acyltransferase [Chloroflexota bacterium]TMD82055.1 MAG: acyltransferase [Chloroflexota bacterium]
MSLSSLYLRLRYPRHRFGPGFRGPLRLRIRGRGRVIIGRDVSVSNASGRTALLTFGPQARIEIGDRVEIDGAGLMSASTIVVGDDAILGPCLIVDTDFHAIGRLRRQPGESASRGPIRIGRQAWIQGKATILKGVAIGDRAVIRWGSLVTTDVAPGAVVMGNPALEVSGTRR